MDSWGVDAVGYPAQWITHYQYVYKADGYVPADKRATYAAELSKVGDYSRFAGLYATGTLRWYGRPIWNIDATPVMAAITLPTLIVWGEKNGILPAPWPRPRRTTSALRPSRSASSTWRVQGTRP